MLMMQYIHHELSEVVKTAYPEDYDQYLSFYVSFEFNERKKEPYSKYDFHSRKLVCSNLSRNPADIFISFLQELAHHIDIKKRNETHDDFSYYAICKKLIDNALKLNKITLQELYQTKNLKLKNKLQENFGSFKNWKYTLLPTNDSIYILVFDAFMIRNNLKANKYYYDSDQRAWTKFIKRIDYEEESYLIQGNRHKATFKIIDDGSFFIRPSYELKVETFSINDSELWKAFSYFYDRKSKRWIKHIYADELRQELEMIADLPKQKVLISQIKWQNNPMPF